jgi:hypothetical protein
LIIRHVRISNKTATAAAFSLWIGATGGNVAGTEFMGTGQLVPPNGYVDWFGMVRLDTTDYLVGGAGTTDALTLEARRQEFLAQFSSQTDRVVSLEMQMHYSSIIPTNAWASDHLLHTQSSRSEVMYALTTLLPHRQAQQALSLVG